MSSLPAVVKPTAMPVTAKHASQLVWLDGDGRPVKYGPASLLVPAADLAAVVAEVDAMNARIPDSEEAGKMGKSLIGAYPNERAKDPATYAAAMFSVFVAFPRDVGWKAIDAITLESEFPPTRAELHKTCSRLLWERNALVLAAQAQLSEHERRAVEKPSSSGKLVRDMSDSERDEFFRDLRAKYPGGFSIAEAIVGKGDEPERGSVVLNQVVGK